MRSFPDRQFLNLVAAACFLVCPINGAAQERDLINGLRFTQTAGIQVPLTDCNNTQLRTGIGFDVQLSYPVFVHWHAYFSAGWNDFLVRTPAAERTAFSAVQEEIQGGLQFENDINDRFQWFVSAGCGISKTEFFSEYGHLTGNTPRAQGYSGATGLSAELVEGLELGVFVKITRYLPVAGLRTAADRAAAGASVRWIVW